MHQKSIHLPYIPSLRRMGRYLLLLALLADTAFLAAQEPQGRPAIGVTLSGGGAKGLAHIGILKAIDSAGLKVDYITGTSMGSIIGALYAVGYSADDIEKMARKVDWGVMLTNQSSLRGIVMQEKDEYGKYAIELPWEDRGFRLPSGVFEGEELWLKFTELFYPVYNIKDFDNFSIPFRSVSADLATGEAVVSDSGEIVTAVRASMAIPSVFTAIEHNGRKLIDGGVVRNFPVRDVKEMGADIVIGSRVAVGLQPKEKVNNALQVLMQIAFFKEAESSREDISLCDIYIPMPLEDYTAASFSRAEDILAIGIREGRKLYPQFRRIADSLNTLYGSAYTPLHRLPQVDSIRISDIEIRGLEKTTVAFFEHMMGFEKDRYYTSGRLGRMVRKLFGTRYYSRIVYALEPLPDGTVKIIFTVVENPASFAKLGIHYNNFTGISIITNLTSRNFFLPHSRSHVTLNIGENFRARAEHLQYLGRGKNVALVLAAQFDNLSFDTYNDFKRDGLYRMQLFKGDARMEYSANRTFTIGAGSRFEWIRYRPSVQSVFEISGKNELLTTYGFFGINNLNRNIFPDRGLRVDGEFGWVYNQSPSLTFYSRGEPIANPDSIGISYSNYHRAILNLEAYAPLPPKLTLTTAFQSGINFNYNQSILNDFVIGGLTRTFRNQVLFAGLSENSISTPSVAAAQIGLRYEMFRNLYITARTNGLVNNFISTNNLLQKPNFLSGHAIGFAYNFAIGPLEINAMYCDQSRRLRSYINLGIAF